MRYKKAALYGFGLLGILLAASLFFAQTWMNMRSAKVLVASPVKGTITKRYDIKGILDFYPKGEVVLHDAAKYPITIDEVFVGAGHAVTKGERLFSASVDHSFARDCDQITEALRAARAALSQLEFDGVQSKVNPNATQAEEAINDIELKARAFELRLRIMDLADKKDASLPEDCALWRGAATRDPELDGLLAKWQETCDALAERDRSAKKRYGKIKAKDYRYCLERFRMVREIERLEKEALRLARLRQALTCVRADEDGVLLSTAVQKGRRYNGETPLYTWAKKPVPAVLTPVNARNLNAMGIGSPCAFQLGDLDLSGVVAEFARLDVKGEHMPCAVIQLESGKALSLEDFQRMAGQQISGEFSWESDVYDCLVPTSCIVTRSGGQYLYVIGRVQGAWGDEMRISEQKVTVVMYNDQYAALAKPLPMGTQLADKWDRPLASGMRVIKLL